MTPALAARLAPLLSHEVALVASQGEVARAPVRFGPDCTNADEVEFLDFPKTAVVTAVRIVEGDELIIETKVKPTKVVRGDAVVFRQGKLRVA